VWLGIQAIRHRADARLTMTATEPVAVKDTSPWRSVWTGVLVGVTNPKTIVFFAAFLPQFIDPGAPAAPQLLLLGAVFGVLAVASDSSWALAAGRARDRFAPDPKRLDRLGATGGVMMVGLGATLATTGNATH
jgi:threonine/homoserine/homoserine lactone efflux protein